jgi:hypothetical protein
MPRRRFWRITQYHIRGFDNACVSRARYCADHPHEEVTRL